MIGAPTIWRPFGKRAYRLRVWIMQETLNDEPNGFSVLAADLPGCGSQGETIKECLENIKEAFVGCALCYRDDDVPIPWELNRERPLFHEERSIVVELPDPPSEMGD